VRSDAGFDAAASAFCDGVTTLFANPGPVARHIDDAGDYAVLAILMAAAAEPGTIGVPSRTIIETVTRHGLCSPRRVTRRLAQLADRGLVRVHESPADRRVQMASVQPVVTDFFVRWHDAHLAPLALLADPALQRRAAATAASSACWQAIVANMARQRGVVLIQPFPAVAQLMRQARGYPMMLAWQRDPTASAGALARRFGGSRSHAHRLLGVIRKIEMATVQRWIATELALAALVAERCAGAGLFGETTQDGPITAAARASQLPRLGTNL
jgi:hypothetical protein